MAIAPEGIGLQIGPVWVGSRDASGVPLEAWIPAVVVFACPTPKQQLVYPLNLHQARSMRDKCVELSTYEKPKPKPKTAGERYAATKTSKAAMGMTITFDHETDGIHLSDRAATPGLDPSAVGTISFKGEGMHGVRAVPFSAADFASFAKTLTEVLERHEEPPS